MSEQIKKEELSTININWSGISIPINADIRKDISNLIYGSKNTPKIKTHTEQINAILTKYQAKYTEYMKDYAFLATLFHDCLTEIDECVHAEG
jgi:hypothetical protein